MTQFRRKGKWMEIHVSAMDQGEMVEEVLRKRIHVSGRLLQRLTRRNGIQLNGKKSHLSAIVKTGDRIQVSLFPKEEYGVDPEYIPIEILYEDDHILVINKQSGLAVHPTSPDEKGTLANAVAFYYQSQGIESKVRHIHRLDKDTSGAILLAKHELAHSLLDEELRKRSIKRQYLAVVEGTLKESRGTIDLPIGRDRHHPTRRRVSPSGDPAITHYEVVEQYTKGSLLRLELETGRTHQIRVHLSHIGHPIMGDSLYGGRTTWIRRQALHGERLKLHHPFTHEELTINAPIPEDIIKLIDHLKSE